jgi:hypothetical protein
MKIRLLVLFIFTLFDLAWGQNQKKVRLGFEAEFGYEGNRTGILDSVPLSARTIPHHPDDPAYWKFVLPDKGYAIRTAEMYTSIAPKLILGGRIAFIGGPIWNIPVSTDDSEIVEVNQYGSSARGSGMSLAWGKAVSKFSATPGFFADAELFLGGAFSIVGGYQMSKLNYVFDRGYDRYDSLSDLDSVPLATHHLAGPEFGVKIGRLGNKGGKIIAVKLMALRTGTPELAGIPNFLLDKKDWKFKGSLVFGFSK